MRWVLDPEECELRGQQLAEREGIAPLPALMRVLTDEIGKRDLPPELRAICEWAGQFWRDRRPEDPRTSALNTQRVKAWVEQGVEVATLDEGEPR